MSKSKKSKPKTEGLGWDPSLTNHEDGGVYRLLEQIWAKDKSAGDTVAAFLNAKSMFIEAVDGTMRFTGANALDTFDEELNKAMVKFLKRMLERIEEDQRSK